jgi:hypothetical protein
MAMVPKYTSRASVPGSTGQQQVSLSLASSPLSGVGEGLTKVAGQLEAAAGRIQAREDIISSAVANDQFEQETLKSYNSALEAGNILDPKQNTIGNFNAETEQRIMQTVNNFGGSANAKAQLEASLRSRAGQYANQMIRYQNTEQRKYITETAQNEMAPIISAITKDPSALRGSVEQIEAIVSKYAPALDPDSQRSLRDAALSGAMEQSVTGLLNRGAWKEANSMLMDNPILMRYLDPSKKDQFNRQIANFAQAENKSRVEMAGKVAQLDAIRAAGYPVDPRKAANFIAGTTVAPDATLGEKITATGKSLVETGMMTQDEFNKLPINIKASFGGVKLPERPPVDYNKDFLPGGKLSPKGVYGRIKPYMEASTEIQRQSSMLENLYAQYKTNPLAGLGILQGYLKMIDDGAVVRDSDIRLAESASSAATRFQTAINSLTKGEAVSESLVEQAILAARAFTSGANEVSKTTVDGYLEDTGYSMMQMGYPQATYDLLFNKVRTVPLKKEQVDEVGGPGTADADAAKEADPGVVVITRNPDGTLNMDTQ